MSVKRKYERRTRFTLGDLGDQALDLLETLEISRERDALARTELGQLSSDLVANTSGTGRDVDLGAVDNEAVGNHQADAATAASDQDDLVLDVEE